ncbi:kinase-like domain-containing protein [Trichophaea hybrida]|nr:kinase-like domain-containing protein [Trichophaea hybrida]
MSKTKSRPKSPVPQRKRYEPTPPPTTRTAIMKDRWRTTPTIRKQKSKTPSVKTEEGEINASVPLEKRPSLSPKTVAGPPPGLEATPRYDWNNFEAEPGPAPELVVSVYSNPNNSYTEAHTNNDNTGTEAHIMPSKSKAQNLNASANDCDALQRATTEEPRSSQKRKRGSAGVESRVQSIPIANEDNHSSQLRRPRKQTPMPPPYQDSRSGTASPAEAEPQVNRTKPATPAPDLENPNTDLLPGYTLCSGRYLITGIHGRGSFSTCYKAYDTVAQKTVNIKTFNPRWARVGQSEANILEYFRDSARVINIEDTFWSENHPGSAPEQNFNVVTEALWPEPSIELPPCRCPYPEHASIACPVRHKALAKIMSQVLTGLAEIHHRDFIHADLTPSNILFSPASGLAVTVIDLSNAIRRDERASYEEDYNVQTACYRSPEMLLGYGPVGKHIDIWSAGVIAIELLFGKDITMAGGIEGAELLRSPVEGRDAVVRRMIDLFGSVNSCEDGMYWYPVYKELSTRWGWDKKHGKIKLGEQIGAISDILERTGNYDLRKWILGMVDPDYKSRSTIQEALRDPWLVYTLLGEWGTVLQMDGFCDDEDERVFERRVRRRVSSPRREVRDFGVQADIPASSPPLLPPLFGFEDEAEDGDEDDSVELVY